jgi:hypothetical protein
MERRWLEKNLELRTLKDPSPLATPKVRLGNND